MDRQTFSCFLLFLLLSAGQGICQFTDNFHNATVYSPGNSISSDSLKISHCQEIAIGQNDSVIFNLSSAYQLSSYVDIPVFIRSAAVINSLDFEIRYNEQRVLFDTLIVLNTNLQYLYYYNIQDSTLRFTSNSLISIINDSIQLILRFEVLSTPMCSNDIQDVNALLTGDLCSHYVSNCVILGTSDLPFKNNPQVYPNPASDFLKINPVADAIFQIFDIKGNPISKPINIYKGTAITLSTVLFPAGLYFYRFQMESTNYTGKVVVSR